MKIRYILIIALAAVLFNQVFTALNESDYNHCRVTSHHSVRECSELTGYTPE